MTEKGKLQQSLEKQLANLRAELRRAPYGSKQQDDLEQQIANLEREIVEVKKLAKEEDS